MPDDQNPTQNPTPEENPSPTSPSHSAQSSGETRQEPMADAPIPPIDSESFGDTQDLRPSDAPPEALESTRNADILVSLKDYYCTKSDTIHRKTYVKYSTKIA